MSVHVRTFILDLLVRTDTELIFSELLIMELDIFRVRQNLVYQSGYAYNVQPKIDLVDFYIAKGYTVCPVELRRKLKIGEFKGINKPSFVQLEFDF